MYYKPDRKCEYMCSGTKGPKGARQYSAGAVHTYGADTAGAGALTPLFRWW